MEHHIMSGIILDGNGIALVIAACCTGAVTIGTLIMQIITFFDARQLKKLSMARDNQIREVKDLVNGKSEVLQQYVAKEAYEKGREHERLAPGTPSPTVGVVPVNTVVTGIPRNEDASAAALDAANADNQRNKP
jgi:hypothetical protein